MSTSKLALAAASTVAATVVGSASADVLLTVDLTVENEITIVSTTRAAGSSQ